MEMIWSEPVPYDLTRTRKRASVPRSIERSVPESPGTYVIFRIGQGQISDSIVGIGECGPRLNSTPCGLRGRLASNVAHSASERMARDIVQGALVGDLRIAWRRAKSKAEAKEVQDGLIALFRQDFGRQPIYNAKVEDSPNPEAVQAVYKELKVLIRSGQ